MQGAMITFVRQNDVYSHISQPWIGKETLKRWRYVCIYVWHPRRSGCAPQRNALVLWEFLRTPLCLGQDNMYNPTFPVLQIYSSISQYSTYLSTPNNSAFNLLGRSCSMIHTSRYHTSCTRNLPAKKLEVATRTAAATVCRWSLVLKWKKYRWLTPP